MNRPADDGREAGEQALDAALARFLDHLAVEKQASPHTLDAYRRDLAALRTWAGTQGFAGWGGIDGLALRGFVADEHARGLSPPSVQRRLSACRALFRWLLKHGEIAADPSAGLRGPKAPRKLPQVLDADEMGQLVEVPDDAPLGLRDRAMMELFYSSGLRVSELCALRWGDLDLVGGEVRVLGKGRKTRIVPVGRHAREALAAWAASEAASASSASSGVASPGARPRRRTDHATRGAEARSRAGHASRRVEARASASVSAQLRQPRAGKLRRSARRAGAVGSRQHRDHPDLHPPRFPAPRQGLRRRAPARETEALKRRRPGLPRAFLCIVARQREAVSGCATHDGSWRDHSENARSASCQTPMRGVPSLKLPT
jgi:integrase/recombinase XerC